MGDTMTHHINPNALRKGDVLAMDRMTVRSMDVDGRMHVEITNISKANVCPYYGAEIPNYEALGLDPNRVYMLYRDPVELAKAALTFNGIQLMGKHIPVSATDTQKFDVVGCLGNDAVFEPPYLKNSLTVWDASAIAGIETGDQRELSSSYRYVADMTPGVDPDGVPFDGRMTEIVGNHVALVETGRAGADVTVGDSLPPELLPMKLSKKAVAMRAALGAYLRPLLAQDGTIPQLRAIVRGNKKPAFVAMDAKSVFKDLDLNVDDLTRVLTLAADEAEAEEDDMAGDEDETEEERKEREAKEKKAADEAEEEAKKKAEDEEEGKKDDRKANDAAIARVRADARQDAIREFTAIRQAEEDVRPLVGAVVAMDSAEAVYRFALDSIGVDAKDVHASALPALVNMAKERHAKPVASRLASDAASESSFSARFPTATKLKRA